MSEPRAVVIAHGKSEVILAKRIASRLGMGLSVYSRKNGEETIRISDLPALFETGPFSSEKRLHAEFPELEYLKKGECRMPDLRIFPIMDIDGDHRRRNSYVSGEMFRPYALGGKVVPIFNDDNLDIVMEDIGFGSVIPKKVRSFHEIADRILDVPAFHAKLVPCCRTNLEQFTEYCLSTRPCYQGRRFN